MTKTELQSALAEATQTDKRTAGVFLDTLSDIAYKLARFWQTRKAEEEGPHRDKSQDATADQDSSQDGRQIACGQGRKGRGFGGKEVVKEL